MFKVIWDKENNGVKLTSRSGGEELNPPRPVFHEELDLLKMNERGWCYPQSDAPLLWACDRRYFYKGELVLEVKGGNIFDDPTVVVAPAGEGLKLMPIDMEALKAANEDTMFLLEHEAMNFIDQTYRRYKKAKEINDRDSEGIDMQQLAELQEKKTKEKHVVVKDTCDSFDVVSETEAQRQGKDPIVNSKIELFVSSFSGGKDSQVVLDLVSRTLPENDFCVIYSDTGYELPTSLRLYQTIQEFYHKLYPNLNFYTAKNHQPILYYWDQMGAPSRIHRWCCSVMKSAPLSRMLKQINTLERQPQVILFEGVRAEESSRRATYSRIGQNVKHNNMINARPIVDWNQTEVYLYLILNNIPFNSAYRVGLSRVGCIICPFSSDWSEDVCSKVFSETMDPFLRKLREGLTALNIKGVDNYIKLGNWKMRAGGRDSSHQSLLSIAKENPDFKATIHHPQENIWTWLKVLGDYTCRQENNSYIGELKYGKSIISFKITINETEDNILIDIPNCGYDVVFVGRLKRILYKTTYCAHCEVCEVECPTGALSVVPIVSVNSNKCKHCFKCLEFIQKGCKVADSISLSNEQKIQTNNMKNTKSSIDRYKDGMGLREKWLKKYFDSYQSFFDNDEHGLNTKHQLPPFTNWIREAGILQNENKEITETGLLLAKTYTTNPLIVWELIFINLSYNSEICKWFQSSIGFNREYLREEMDVILQNNYPDFTDRTLSNPFNSLINTFKESPLCSQIPIAVLSKSGNKVSIRRTPYNDLSLVALAYSLYRFGETVGRKDLTISELYQENQTTGPYRQFGIDRDVLERKLRSLQEGHQVLTVNLNMGLDNINLREDLQAIDVLKMML